MCTVSVVGDFYADRWRYVPVPTMPLQPSQTYPIQPTWVTKAEFEVLKREVAEMKELLIMAKRIDEATGQPDCEMAEKLAVLRRVAELVGIDLDDVLAP